MRALKIFGGAAALALVLAPGAHADEWNKRTYLTFSGPVQLPGRTLPAGTYTFELASPDTSRHVIRVSEKESNKPIGMFLTIPNDRMQAPDDNLIMFAERPKGSPQAVQAWFYPGDRIGEEFVYPKQQAMMIAKANKRGVLATEAGGVMNTESVKTATYGRVDASGREVKDDARAETTTARSSTTTAAPANTATGSRPSRTETTTARSTTADQGVGTSGAQSSTAQSTTANRRRSLPRTASNLVTYELLSGLAFGASMLIRKIRN